MDILRVINNEVAVPHYREIHRQLTDFHSLVQILEAKDGEKERGGGDGEIGVEKREVDFNGRSGNFPFRWALVDAALQYVLPKLPQSYIMSSSESLTK